MGAELFELVTGGRFGCLEDVLGRRKIEPDRPGRDAAGAPGAVGLRPLGAPTEEPGWLEIE